MSLVLIGLGLCDAQDVTVRGLSFIKAADKVYLEEYTSILQVSKEELESTWNKKISSVVRIDLESNLQEIITEAKSLKVVICFVGDPLFATTHTAIMIEAKKQNVETGIIHNASVFSAVADIGLHMYKFGRVTSIPFHNKEVIAPYSILEQNLGINAHTLFLLDLIPTENKFLSIQEALNYLKSVEAIQKKGLINDKTKIVACARLGSKNQVIKYGTYKELNDINFGNPPFCLIVPASLHFSEKEMLETWQL